MFVQIDCIYKDDAVSAVCSFEPFWIIAMLHIQKGVFTPEKWNIRVLCLHKKWEKSQFKHYSII